MRLKKAVTLIELLLASVMVVFVLGSVIVLHTFYANYAQNNANRTDNISQINYALEDMRIRCKSAIQIDSSSFFNPNGEE